MSRLYGKMQPRLIGLPYLADRATRLGGLPHLSCKHDQIKMRDYMARRVTPLRRVTPPTWGPPPPCKQALKLFLLYHNHFNARALIGQSAMDYCAGIARLLNYYCGLKKSPQPSLHAISRFWRKFLLPKSLDKSS